MRKLSLPITAFALGALLLSACAGAATNVAPTQGAGAGASSTSTPLAGAATSAPTSAATSAPTTGATANATTAPTTGATTAPTSAATSTTAPTSAATATIAAGNATPAAGTETPAAGANATSTPSTSTSTGQTVTYVRLSDLFKLNVSAKSQASTTLGTVDGVVLDRPAVSASAGSSSASASVSPAVVRYVVVKGQDSSAHDVLVPWQAFAFDQAGATAQNGVLSMTALTMDVDPTAFAGAPAFDRSASGMTNSGWDAGVISYWSSHGLGIPATGTSNANAGQRNQVLVDQQMLSSLKVSGPDNTQLGSVSDFLVNARTGEVVYAILTGGAAFNNQSFVVPLNNLNWSGTTGVDIGSLIANFPNDILKNAPSLNGVTLPQDWSTQIQNFWNSINK